MNAYWQQLNERERLAIGTCVVAVFIYILYLLVLAPLADAVHQKTRLRAEKQQTLRWMQQVRGQTLSANQPELLTNAELLSLLARQLKRPEFKPFAYQLQQIGSGDIQLTFENIPFNPFIKWLQKLNTTYAFSLKQFKAQRTNTEGVVSLSLILTAK